jgi:nucleotide-binding universal stress UspA family protein
MFRNVLIGVDGSQTGRDAIALATALVRPGGRLTLAHVDVPVYASSHPLQDARHERAGHAGGDALGEGAGREAGDAPGEGAGREAGDARGEGAGREAGDGRTAGLLEDERRAAGVRAELIEISESSVGRGLHSLAEDLEADLLVVGSCSHGLAGRTLVGDDTRASLNGASCAVAVAPRGYASHPQALAVVGVGCDFSGESHAAVAAAREIAAQHGGRLEGLHVLAQPIGAYAAPMPLNWGEVLEADRKAAEGRLASVEGVDGSAVYGVAGEELAVFGERVNLLVVGSRGYGPFRRLMFGSTSNRLARHARCPLLVLPRTATTRAGATDIGERAGRGEAPVGATV